jgi:hypothetical protein
MRYPLFYAAVALAALAPAGVGRAATLIHNNGSPYTYKVHANSAGSGTSLTLHTKQIQSFVTVSSSDMIDVGNGDGEAQVNGIGRFDFSDVTIDPDLNFTIMQFKIDGPNGNTPGHDFDLLVTFVGGATQNFSNVLLPANDKLDIVAGANEVIDKITFSDMRSDAGASQDFRALKQISFEAAAPVPEPATWAMMIGGLGMLGAVARRRRSMAVTFA